MLRLFLFNGRFSLDRLCLSPHLFILGFHTFQFQLNPLPLNLRLLRLGLLLGLKLLDNFLLDLFRGKILILRVNPKKRLHLGKNLFLVWDVAHFKRQVDQIRDDLRWALLDPLNDQLHVLLTHSVRRRRIGNHQVIFPLSDVVLEDDVTVGALHRLIDCHKLFSARKPIGNAEDLLSRP